MRLRREANYKTSYLKQVDLANTEMSKYKEKLEECEGASCGKYNWFRREI